MRLLGTLLLLTAVASAEEKPVDPSLEREVERYIAQVGPEEPDPDVVNARWREGPVFEKDDGSFQMRIRARALIDIFGVESSDYDEPVTDSGIFIRQVRLGVVGYFYTHTIYMLEIEFNNGNPRIRDVFLGLKNIGPRNRARLKLGNMREPFGLDGTTPIPFHVNLERAPSSRAFQLGRNAGVRLHGRELRNRFTWWIGLFRSTDGSGSPQGDGGHAITVRLTGLPIRDGSRLFHVGVSASYRDTVDDTISYRSRAGPNTGPRLVDTGDLAATNAYQIALELAYRTGPLTVQVEGYVSEVTGLGVDAAFWGAYALVSWWITGEVAPYDEWNAVWDRVSPRKPSGAWLVTLRFDRIDLTDGTIDGGEMNTITLGTTWMMNPNARWKLDAVWADVEGGPFGSGQVFYLITRIQFDF